MNNKKNTDYNIVKDLTLKIPDGWELVEIGKEMTEKYKFCTPINFMNSDNINNWWAGSCIGHTIKDTWFPIIKPKGAGIPITPAAPVVLKPKYKKLKRTRIHFGKKLTAPDGYVFLSDNDILKQGDKYWNHNQNKIYDYCISFINKDNKHFSYYPFPSIRPIKKKNKVIEAKLDFNYKPIADFKVGDVFTWSQNGEPVIICSNHNNEEFYLLGHQNSLQKFSTPYTKEELITYLNKYMYIYITNISNQISKTLDMARKLIVDFNKSKANK